MPGDTAEGQGSLPVKLSAWLKPGNISNPTRPTAASGPGDRRRVAAPGRRNDPLRDRRSSVATLGARIQAQRRSR